MLLSIAPGLRDENTVAFVGGEDADALYLRVAADNVLEFSETGNAGEYSRDLDPVAAEDQTRLITPSTWIIVELAGGDDRLVIQSSDLVGIEFEGGEGYDTVDFSLVGEPLEFKFSPTTVTVPGAIDAPPRIKAADVEGLIGGSTGQDTVDLSENQEHLVFVVRQAGTVTIAAGDYTVNPDGTIAVSDESASFDAGNIENLVGGQGDNTFVFEDGATLLGTIDGGGGGSNTLDYSAYTGSVAADLSLGTATATAGITNIQNITGGSHNDILSGDANPNTITGGAGSDSIVGGDGPDLLFLSDLEQVSGTTVNGGGGDDALDLSEQQSDLTFTFTSFSDLSISDNASVPNTVQVLDVETLFAGDGSDTLDLSSSIENLTVIIHNYGGITVTDGGYTVNEDGTFSPWDGFGAVTVNGVENIIGGQGNDAFVFEDWAYLFGTIDGGAGDANSLDYSAYTKGMRVELESKTATGTSGISNIHNVTGGTGDDTIGGNDGDNILDGGAGNDTIDYGGSLAGVTVVLSIFTAQDTVGAGQDTLANFENLIGSPFADDLTGDDNANVLDGGEGHDSLTGGGGDDTYLLGPNSGIDTLFENAGEGSDTLDYSLVAESFVFTIHTGGAVSATDDTHSVSNASGFENLIGGSGENTFTFENGAAIAGTIDGGAGSVNTLNYALYDSAVHVDLGAGMATGTAGVSRIHNIIGGSGNDDLTGDANANMIDGGFGDDTINGGGGVDTVDYSTASASVNVNLASGSTTGGGGSDTLQHVENIVGSPYADTLTGDTNDNIIDGDLGNDTIDGGGGTDTVDYGTAPAGVSVNLATGIVTGGGGSDTVQNVENIVGSPFADSLTGDANANVFDGGLGNDTLIGAAGDDTYRMIGHWGTDTITEAADGGSDTLAVMGSAENDLFHIGSTLVERLDPDTQAVADSVGYGSGIESFILGGTGEQTMSEITFDNDLFAPGGITATAEESITVATGVTLSTRQVSGVDHLGGNSAGHSGNITFNAPKIDVLSGAQLLAHVEEDSDYDPGDITLTAEAGSDLLGTLVRIEDITSGITLAGATVKGATVIIQASADTVTKSSDVENFGDFASFAMDNVIPGFIGPLLLFGGFSSSKATATVDIQSGTYIEAAIADIKATADTGAVIRTIFTALAVAYGHSEPTARVYVQDDVTITTTGDLAISTTANSKMSISAYALNLGPGRGAKWDATAALSFAAIESTSQIHSGANIDVGGDLWVAAKTTKNHSTSALGGAYADGTLGLGFAFSQCTNVANAFVDGTVLVDGHVSIDAKSEVPKNDISASAVTGTGAVAGLVLKPTTAFADWIRSMKSSKVSEKSLGISAALAIAVDTNEANARIGDGEHSANVTSRNGSIEVTASTLDVPEIAANATVDTEAKLIKWKMSEHKKKNAVAAAIVVGNFNNFTDAHIGSNATVSAEGFVAVTSDAVVPYETQWWQYHGVGDITDKLNSNLGLQNGFFTSWARSAATGDDIGISGSINVVNFNNTSEAYIGENATVLQRTLAFNPADDVTADKVSLGAAHGLNSGQQVVYNNGGGSDLGGLTSGSTYYVLFNASEPKYIKLAETLDGDALVLNKADTAGERHLLYKLTPEQEETCSFDPSDNSVVFDPAGMTGQSDQINFDSPHHFYDGQEVVYKNGVERILNAFAYLDAENHAFQVGTDHGFSVGDAVVYYVESGKGLQGLTSGNTYYVVEATETQIKLSDTSVGDALEIDFLDNSPYSAQGTRIRLALIDLGGLVNGETYYVKYVDDQTVKLASEAGGEAIQLDFDRAVGEAHSLRSKYAVYVDTHSFAAGDAVRYTNGGGFDLEGLRNNGIYYVIDAGDSYLKLAETRHDAADKIAIEIDSLNTIGDAHTLSSEEGVTVEATSRIMTVNFAGVYGLNPMKFFLTGGDTAGVGVSVLHVGYQSTAKAQIKDGALVSASNLRVDGDRINREVSVAISGGTGKKFGASVTTSTVTVTGSEDDEPDTLAHISDGAVIVLQDANAGLHVTAGDHSLILNVTGGVLLGNTVGIGASVAVNKIDRDTLAVIGNREQDEAGSGYIFTPGSILVSAENTGKIICTSVAGTFPRPAFFDSKAAGGAQAPANAATPPGKFGLNVSGAVAWNTVQDTAEAYLRDADIRQANDVTLNATNDSRIVAVAGSVAFAYSGNSGLSVGVAGALGRNLIRDTAKAYIEDSTISASGDLSLNSLTTGQIVSVAASGSGAVRDAAVAIAPSVSWNKTNNTTESYIKGTTVSDVHRVDLDAKDNSEITADGGGVALAIGKNADGAGVGVAVGFSLAWNKIDNKIKAYVEDSTVTAGENVELTAASTAIVQGWSIGGALAVGWSSTGTGLAGAGAGAGAYNEIANTVEAYVTENANVTTTGGDLAISARDDSEIGVDAGGFAVTVAYGSQNAVAVSVGVSIGDNDIENQVRAYLAGSTVSAHNVTLTAESTATIQCWSVAGAVAVGVAGSGSIGGGAGAGAGAGSYSEVTNTVEAYITGGSTVTATSGDVTVTATDSRPLFTTAGHEFVDELDQEQLPKTCGRTLWQTVSTRL